MKIVAMATAIPLWMTGVLVHSKHMLKYQEASTQPCIVIFNICNTFTANCFKVIMLTLSTLHKHNVQIVAAIFLSRRQVAQRQHVIVQLYRGCCYACNNLLYSFHMKTNSCTDHFSVMSMSFLYYGVHVLLNSWSIIGK